MQKIILGGGMMMSLIACQPAKPLMTIEPSTTQTSQQFTRNLIIFYDQEHGAAALLAAAHRYGAPVVYQYQNMNGIAVAIPAKRDMAHAIQYFENVSGVLQVNRDSVLQLQ